MRKTRVAHNTQEISSHPQRESQSKHQNHQNQTLKHPNFHKQSSDIFPNEPNLLDLVRKHISHGSPREAVVLFNQNRQRGAYVLGVLPLIFKACASLSSLNNGKALHGEAIKTGVVYDVMVGTSLVDMYAKCGDIVASSKVFDDMPERNVVTSNAMISGYLRNGDTEIASVLFEKMSTRTAVTWIEMIRAFARTGDTVKARGLFDKVPGELKNVAVWTVMVEGYASNGEIEAARELFKQMPEKNFFVWSSMISGYCKKGDVEEARTIFDSIPTRNLVNWNSLISGCAQNGFCEQALEAFRKMQDEGFEPDEVTAVSILSACAQLGQLNAGKEIHCMINRKEMKLNHFVLNALVDMYAKCGDLTNARLICDKFIQRNNRCWNAMISGFAIHGQIKEALQVFRSMEDSDERPDEITFLSVLSACAHGGFVELGLEIFSKMEKYGLAPGVKHYGCLVDLLGRAGRLKEAYDLVKKMPMKPNDAVWGALIAACRIHLDLDVVERLMEEVGTLDHDMNSDNDSHYVLASNTYAASDKWEKAERMRMIMVNKGLQKTAGCSSVMVSETKQGQCHHFSRPKAKRPIHSACVNDYF